MILTEKGKITLRSGEGVATTRTKISTNGVLSGGFVGLASSDTGTQNVLSVAHTDAAAADASIAAVGANVTLAKSGTTFTIN